MNITEARHVIRRVLDAYQDIYWAREENSTGLRDLTPAEDKFLSDCHTIADRHNTRVGSVQRQYGDRSRRHLQEIEASMIDKAHDLLAAHEALRNSYEFQEEVA